VSVEVRKDLSGKDRILTATLPGTSLVPLGALDAGEKVAVIEALAAGALIGVPTDTVYGIAARWDSQSGIRRLSVAKGRVADQPMAVLFPSVDAVEAALPDLDISSRKVLRSLLPGPFTFVVGTSLARPHLVGTRDSLGVRVPDHPSLLDFLESLGTPLAATSANLSGEAEAGGPSDVEPAVLAHCSIALIDPHPLPPADPPLASTVVDLRPLATGGDPLILRQGVGKGRETLERIRRVMRGSVN
jgi:L-threonylcarbamoyladenylate synthase